MFRVRALIVAFALGLLAPLAGCGQSKPAAKTTPAPPKAPVVAPGPAPQRAADVCVTATPSTACQLADGSRLYLGISRADNHNVPGLARYRPDGQLDTAFCRRVARVLPYCYKVLAAPGGKLWVQGSVGQRFGIYAPSVIVRLNADGTADTTFTAAVQTDLTAWCVLPGGRLLLAGNYLSMPKQSLGSLACLQANGRLDDAFMAALGKYQGTVSSLICQPDGRILVGGNVRRTSEQAALALWRLNANGSFDATFQPLPASSRPLMALALQPDGKPLVLLGRGRGSLLRLLPTGAADPSFVLKLRQPLNVINGQPPLLVLADGRILLPGHVAEKRPADGRSWRSLLCVSAAGEEDTTFRYRAQPAWIFSLQQLPGGRILATTTPTPYPDLPATRGEPIGTVVLAANGRPVPGQPVPRLERAGQVTALAAQPDGQLVLAGSFTAVAGTPAHGLARLDLDGSPDTAFARRCAVDGAVSHLVAQADGRLLVAGYFENVGGLRRPLLARLLPDGRPDPDFAPPLAYWAELGAGLRGLAVQADGKVLLSGRFKLSDGIEQRLLRLTATGQPDPTFQAPQTTEAAGPLLVQPDGKILVASWPVLLRRLLPSGALDPDFAVIRHSGIVTTLAQYPDGRLLVGGSFSGGGFNGIPRLENLARLLPDGRADPAFQPPVFGFRYLYGLGMLPDGRLLVGGDGEPMYNPQPPLYKLQILLPTGAPDPGFDPRTGPIGNVNSLLTYPNGTTFVGGDFMQMGTTAQLGLTRLPPPAAKPVSR